ncbi:endonuclease domain-containing protein [Hydrocarboniphaga effusa]|uniref:endonuclease domain-containing protein n=1 Tax=Hydrocarboniphaga effusa TaxID=243629 RepID=UPI003CC7F91E
MRSNAAVDGDTLRERARGMRSEPTDAESKLWYRLRDRRFFGLKFKRQKPLAGYIVDFICYESRLVIELDGSQHADMQRDYDAKRDRALFEQGYRVLRFWNDSVLRDIDAVLEAIRQACLSPLPLVGEGGPKDRERGGS